MLLFFSIGQLLPTGILLHLGPIFLWLLRPEIYSLCYLVSYSSHGCSVSVFSCHHVPSKRDSLCTSRSFMLVFKRLPVAILSSQTHQFHWFISISFKIVIGHHHCLEFFRRFIVLSLRRCPLLTIFLKSLHTKNSRLNYHISSAAINNCLNFFHLPFQTEMWHKHDVHSFLW